MIKRTMKSNTNRPRSGLPKAAASKAQVELPKLSPSRPGAENVETAKLEGLNSQSTQPVLTKADSAKARLEFVKPEAKSVCVAGSFNGWNPARTPLTRLKDGKWVGELTGISGRHEYLFVVDGQWVTDPNAKESVQNPFGGRNSVLVATA